MFSIAEFLRTAFFYRATPVAASLEMDQLMMTSKVSFSSFTAALFFSPFVTRKIYHGDNIEDEYIFMILALYNCI